MNGGYVKFEFTKEDYLKHQFGLDSLFSEIDQMAKDDLEDLNTRFKNGDIKLESRWVFTKWMIDIIISNMKTTGKLIANFLDSSRIYIKIKAFKNIFKSLHGILPYIVHNTNDILYRFKCLILSLVLPIKYINALAYKNEKRNLEQIIETVNK